MDARVNNFALRSFRETADKDYITARMAYRSRLIQSYRWSALHCLEKYVKGILLLNRISSKKLGHSVLPGIERLKEKGKFEIDLSADTVKFIKHFEEHGADDRYYLYSYDHKPHDIIRLDKAVWEIRRYCQPLDYEITDLNGNVVSSLERELNRIHQAKKLHEKGTCILDGVLENIIAKKDHPARKGLVWNNLFFGTSKRTMVKSRPDWETGNSSFYIYPEIIDEVDKYVYLPKEFVRDVRLFAKQKAAEKSSEA